MTSRTRTTIREIASIFADAASIGLFITAVYVVAGLFKGHI